MGRNEATSAIVESILKITATGATLTLALLAPNAVIALEKPLKKYFSHLEEQDRQREIKRVASYMKSYGLVSGTYEHGLQITKEGLQRLQQLEFDNLHVSSPRRWDHIWRIVFYDIPEDRKAGRDALTRKLQSLGFSQLQRSVFIHPFPCREVIETITTTFAIHEFVSYIETPYIDNQKLLIGRFKKQIRGVSFK